MVGTAENIFSTSLRLRELELGMLVMGSGFSVVRLMEMEEAVGEEEEAAVEELSGLEKKKCRSEMVFKSFF